MRRILRGLIAVVLAAAVLPAAGAIPASAAGSAAAAARAEPEPRPMGSCRVKATDFTYTSFDGTPIDTTLFVPNTATARHPEPAIMVSHGFPGWHRGEGDIADHRMLASHCYVVLAWTERGLGNSGGEIELLDPDFEVRDARGLVTWLAGRPEVQKDRRGDPRLGMFGGSYAGGIQTLLATHDPRVDVITPQVTWNDLRYALYPNGAIKQGWINLLFASGTASGYCGPNFTAPECNPVPPGWTPEAVQHVLVSTAFNGDPTGEVLAWLAKRSPATYAKRWRIPTLLVQGIGDTLFTLNEAIRNYRIVRGNGAPAKLIFFSGGHGQPDDPGERRHINERVLQWLAKYLRGKRSTPTGPPVEVAAQWMPGQDHFVGMKALPPTSSVQFELAAGGGLVPPGTAPGVAGIPIVNSVAPTSYSEVPNFQSSVPLDPTDVGEPATATSFATPAMTRALTVIGQPAVHFTLTSTTGEAIVFWKVYDLAPDGTYELVHRLVTPIRVLGEGQWPATAPITEPVDIRLGLQSIVHRFEVGHRLVLTVATTDTAHYASRLPGVYQIGAGAGSKMLLPAVT